MSRLDSWFTLWEPIPPATLTVLSSMLSESPDTFISQVPALIWAFSTRVISARSENTVTFFISHLDASLLVFGKEWKKFSRNHWTYNWTLLETSSKSIREIWEAIRKLWKVKLRMSFWHVSNTSQRNSSGRSFWRFWEALQLKWVCPSSFFDELLFKTLHSIDWQTLKDSDQLKKEPCQKFDFKLSKGK